MSTTTVCGTRRWASSQAVSDAPWLRGRVRPPRRARPALAPGRCTWAAGDPPLDTGQPAGVAVGEHLERPIDPARHVPDEPAPISPMARQAAAFSSAAGRPAPGGSRRSSVGRGGRPDRSAQGRCAGRRRWSVDERLSMAWSRAASGRRRPWRGRRRGGRTPISGAPRTCMTPMPTATSSTVRQRRSLTMGQVPLLDHGDGLPVRRHRCFTPTVAATAGDGTPRPPRSHRDTPVSDFALAAADGRSPSLLYGGFHLESPMPDLRAAAPSGLAASAPVALVGCRRPALRPPPSRAPRPELPSSSGSSTGT